LDRWWDRKQGTGESIRDAPSDIRGYHRFVAVSVASGADNDPERVIELDRHGICTARAASLPYSDVLQRGFRRYTVCVAMILEYLDADTIAARLRVVYVAVV